MVSVNWQSILKAKPSWADATIRTLTENEKNDLRRINESLKEKSKVKSTKEEKEYFNEFMRNRKAFRGERRRRTAERESRRTRGDEASARVKETVEPEILEELLEEKPEDYSKKRKGYITLKESIINISKI